jgi:hypothetical protein
MQRQQEQELRKRLEEEQRAKSAESQWEVSGISHAPSYVGCNYQLEIDASIRAKPYANT